MRLVKLEEIKNAEIVHFASEKKIITSYHNQINIVSNNIHLRTIILPERFENIILGKSRKLRRALRLDKCNVYPVLNDNLIIIRGGKVYYYNYELNILSITLKLKNCRNLLHQSIAESPDGAIYFGEYGHNRKRKSVPIYKSSDYGMSWEIIFEFKKGSIKHIHGCYYDKYEDKIWVCTGDFENENWIIKADRMFKTIEYIGDGQQMYRTCNFIFRPDYIHWLMDSPLEQSYHIRMNRKTKTIEKLTSFPGPIWYIKELDDGIVLAGVTIEPSKNNLNSSAYLFASTDLRVWQNLCKLEHDGLPMGYFKFGVIGFAEGSQISSKGFYMFFEALKHFDGKSFLYKIE